MARHKVEEMNAIKIETNVFKMRSKKHVTKTQIVQSERVITSYTNAPHPRKANRVGILFSSYGLSLGYDLNTELWKLSKASSKRNLKTLQRDVNENKQEF